MKEDPRWHRLERKFEPHLDWNPLLQATIDLQGLTCDMLDDNAGKAWGEHLDQIKMNHFVYRRAAWGAEEAARKSSFQLWGGGVLYRFMHWVSRFSPGGRADRVSEPSEPLEPWEARRNWIYRQFPADRGIFPGSRRLGKLHLRPQPFEQVILAARAEGRELEALQFEMLRSRIAWRIFNKDIRWLLAPFALIFGALWLWWQEDGRMLTIAALVATLVLMALLSAVDARLRRRVPRRRARWLIRNVLIWSPAAFLFLAGGWWQKPFHFIVAFLIYSSIRLAAVFANAVMRIGTGYLRQPINAFLMIVIAFLIGWTGVHEANRRDMLVVEALPVASLAGPDKHVEWTQMPPRPYDPAGKAIVVGSAKAPNEAAYREIPCSPGLSEPLYALDVLIPLVDLHEESRCSVRRFPVPPPEDVRHREAEPAYHAAQGDHEPDRSCEELRTERPHPIGCMTARELIQAFPSRALESHRFWWWMKALYAIAGWFIVSLALLTFAQVNRTRGEVAES
ncbi:MAG TPA: hypothetical protein VEA61_11450 [Allosphingosinicella sp.]|nr:hypothetical protein [Allosphingosinicella sp.]